MQMQWVMIVVNEGTIVATGTNVLDIDIDTGRNTVVNSGTARGNQRRAGHQQQRREFWAVVGAWSEHHPKWQRDWQRYCINGWCSHTRIPSGLICECNA